MPRFVQYFCFKSKIPFRRNAFFFNTFCFKSTLTFIHAKCFWTGLWQMLGMEIILKWSHKLVVFVFVHFQILSGQVVISTALQQANMLCTSYTVLIAMVNTVPTVLTPVLLSQAVKVCAIINPYPPKSLFRCLSACIYTYCLFAHLE